MTRVDVRGYICRTPAKSGVGIRPPDIQMAHNRVSGFFYALSTATFAIYGGLGEAPAREAGIIWAGGRNLVQFTTRDFDPLVVGNTPNEVHYDYSARVP